MVDNHNFESLDHSQRSKTHKLISKTHVLIIGAVVITILLGLPRVQMMMRLEDFGIADFELRDYIRRISITLILVLLFLWLNLFINNIRLGRLRISFDKIGHLVLANVVVFCVLQLLTISIFSQRLDLEVGSNAKSVYIWLLAVNVLMMAICMLIGIVYRQVKEKYFMRLTHEALQKENAEARFANLKEQINPHFMFNSFSTLNGLIEESPERAKKFLMNMSDLYRYVLQSEQSSSVPLDQELKCAQIYGAMVKERFGAAIQINWDVPAASKYKKVVPLSVQMLLENAVKHNNFNLSNPLTITIHANGAFLEVKNNLRPRKIENSHSLGLYNLNQRYYYLSNKEIVIQNKNEVFSVKIPLLA